MDIKHPILEALLAQQFKHISAFGNLSISKKEIISDDVRSALKGIKLLQSVIDSLHMNRINFDNYRDILADNVKTYNESISWVAAKAIDGFVKHDMKCPACGSTNVSPGTYHSNASCKECKFYFKANGERYSK